jgi:translation initiation factor 2B subunit (eIF-2B alpha/beta/delta family)
MRLNELGEVILLWGVPSNKKIAMIKERGASNRDLCVVVPEMRPHCLGLEVAKRLDEGGIQHTYATDNMVGILFYQHKIKAVLFFYKDLIDDHLVGMCGSLYVCLLAHVHNVPIEPVRGDATTQSFSAASLLDEYMRFQYNHVIEAADEYVPMDIVR